MTLYTAVTDYVVRVDVDDYWTQATYAEADTYFTARGISTWTGENTVKTQALQRAWDYMRNLYWKTDVFEDYITQPDDVTNAHILLALEELKDPGVLTPSLTREDYVSTKGLGGGAISKTYRSNAPAWKRFRGVEMLLGPYIVSSANIRLERG